MTIMEKPKFRAWDKENLKMLYQDRFTINDKLMPFCEQIRWFFWHLENPPIGHKGYSKPMQFTGFRDKSSCEIYAGDILGQKICVGSCKLRVLFVVEFLWKYGAFGSTFNSQPYEYVALTKEKAKKYRVMGNVHQNPQLSKGAKK